MPREPYSIKKADDEDLLKAKTATRTKNSEPEADDKVYLDAGAMSLQRRLKCSKIRGERKGVQRILR